MAAAWVAEAETAATVAAASLAAGAASGVGVGLAGRTAVLAGRVGLTVAAVQRAWGRW